MTRVVKCTETRFFLVIKVLTRGPFLLNVVEHVIITHDDGDNVSGRAAVIAVVLSYTRHIYVTPCGEFAYVREIE